MSVLFSGIINVSGESDSGKTMFAFSCGAQPEDIAFIDDDIKGINVIDQFESQGKKLGYYRNLYKESKGLMELEFHDRCLNIITEIEKEVEKRGNKFEALVWDTFARFEGTFHPYVVTYPMKFRKFWSPNGVIKGAELWKESFRYESEILERLQSVAKLVILASHLKPETLPGGRKSGKFIPDCKQPIIQKSLMRVYLRHNSDGAAPVGLILKRIAKQIVTEDGISIVSVLPRKMKPFTWNEIRRYWNDPIGDRPLTDDERPNEYELSILDGTLTADQKEVLRWQDAPIEDDEEEPISTEFPQEVVDNVNKLVADNKPVPVIARMLNLSIREVNAIIGK